MIKASSIQAVRDATDIVDVISSLVKLDRNRNACCPFHSEKSPSFHVSPAKQIYKCFGCGASGDAIKFIQQHEKLDFIQAIEWLAKFYNIALELEDPQQQARIQKTLDAKKELSAIVEFAYKKYCENAACDTPARAYWNERGYTDEIAERWGFGYAPDSFDFLTHTLINNGKYQPATESGILNESNGKVYDFYRNRLIIPIYDVYGNVTGLAGRWLPTGDAEADKTAAKYYNPKDSLLYNKSKTWFGLYQAITAKAFAKEKDGTIPAAHLVEGYFDVISWHEKEVYSTIAACGTAITEDHVKLLKRHTNHVVLVGDPDSAGFASMLKAIDLFLAADFKVEVIELPDEQDPHDFAINWMPVILEEEPI